LRSANIGADDMPAQWLDQVVEQVIKVGGDDGEQGDHVDLVGAEGINPAPPPRMIVLHSNANGTVVGATVETEDHDDVSEGGGRLANSNRNKTFTNVNINATIAASASHDAFSSSSSQCRGSHTAVTVTTSTTPICHGYASPHVHVLGHRSTSTGVGGVIREQSCNCKSLTVTSNMYS
jgi:hypothetical protein